MKHIRIAIALSVMAGFAAMGCTTYVPHSVSMPATVQTETVKVLGTAEGVASAHWLLGMGPTGDDSLRAATADALAKKGGDALVNVTVDRQITAFPHPKMPLYIKITTRIVGTAVKLKS